MSRKGRPQLGNKRTEKGLSILVPSSSLSSWELLSTQFSGPYAKTIVKREEINEESNRAASREAALWVELKQSIAMSRVPSSEAVLEVV